MNRLLLAVVNFFIFIGDVTINLFRLPLNAVNSIAKFLGPKKRRSKRPLFRAKRIKFFPNLVEYAPIIFKTKYFILGILVSLIFVASIQAYSFVKSLPSPQSIGKVNFASSTHIYDRNGRLLYEIYRDQNRTPVKLKDLPPYVYQSSIAFEDKDFFNHNGVSLVGGVIRAAKETFLKKDLQGGSTITQQLVKNALLTPERTITRKIKEAILALWTERLYTKREILEMYLNQVPYGGSSYGIEEAAKTYFGKSAKELKLEEAALLATLPQAPSLYSPYIDPELTRVRRDDVIKRMKDQGYIKEHEMIAARATSMDFIPPKTTIQAPHFVFYIKSMLEKMYGIQEVEEGGLKVTTSLDLDIQEEAERILREELDRIKGLNVSNGGIVVTKPQSGEIIAMVGSVDYFSAPSGAFNVTTALRQPGSSQKPLMYSLALERNYTTVSPIDDTPITYRISESEAYSPINYDSRFHGRVTLRSALANSYNVPAVKTLNSLGVADYVYHANKLGITTWHDPNRYGLSLALGGGEVTMLDMSTAFGVFANQGFKVPVNGIEKVEDMRGKIIYQAPRRKTRVLSPGVAYIISDILADNDARRPAFGARSALEVPGYKVSVKTGTTNDKKDNWTVGYTSNFLATVWVGNNDNTPMNPHLTSGITGAAPIWNKVMDLVLKRIGNDGRKWIDKPDDIVEKSCGAKVEYFLRGKEAPCAPLRFNTPTPKPN